MVSLVLGSASRNPSPSAPERPSIASMKHESDLPGMMQGARRPGYATQHVPTAVGGKERTQDIDCKIRSAFAAADLGGGE